MIKEMAVPGEIRHGVSLALAKIKKFSPNDFIEEELYNPSTHLLKSPGKLIRPGLVFSSAYSLGQDVTQFVDLAVGIELLHTASLVHDDILDKDSTRRGREAVHTKFGTEKAILSGDALIAKAIQLASAYGGEVVRRASEAAMDMCAGEILDYNRQVSGAPLDLQGYLRIAQLKTASLMAVSTSVVADYLKHSSRQTLYEIGYNIGLSFQLRDDIINHQGAKSDSKNRRPNIVEVFAGHGKENPLKTAIKLSNFYLDSAALLLEKVGKPELFDTYIGYLRMND